MSSQAEEPAAAGNGALAVNAVSTREKSKHTSKAAKHSKMLNVIEYSLAYGGESSQLFSLCFARISKHSRGRAPSSCASETLDTHALMQHWRREAGTGCVVVKGCGKCAHANEEGRKKKRGETKLTAR